MLPTRSGIEAVNPFPPNMADADGVMSKLKSIGTSTKEMILSSKDGKKKFSINNTP